MKSFQLPYPLAYDALPRRPLAQKILQRVRPHTVRTLVVALLMSWILGMLGSQRVILWRYRIRRYPSRRHFKVARFLIWGVRGRRFALHHLRKRFPRRRALSRRATIRTTRRTPRLSFSEMHHAVMGTVVERISSAKSRLHEAFMSLLKGFEVREIVYVFYGTAHVRCALCRE